VAVRTKQLALPTLLVSAGGQTIYTVPANETVIVKTLTIVNGNAAAQTLDVAIGDPSPDIDNHYVIWNHPVAAARSDQILTWIVMTPGQRMWCVPSLGNALVVGAFGTELEGVAD
jgi:hypothetical protein